MHCAILTDLLEATRTAEQHLKGLSDLNLSSTSAFNPAPATAHAEQKCSGGCQSFLYLLGKEQGCSAPGWGQMLPWPRLPGTAPQQTAVLIESSRAGAESESNRSRSSSCCTLPLLARLLPA